MPRRGRTAAAAGSSFSLAAGEQGLRRRRRRRRGSSGVDLEAWRPSLPLRLPRRRDLPLPAPRALSFSGHHLDCRLLAVGTRISLSSSFSHHFFTCCSEKNNFFQFFEIFSFKNFVVTCFLPLLSPLLLLLLLLTPGLLCESERERRARSSPGAVNF